MHKSIPVAYVAFHYKAVVLLLLMLSIVMFFQLFVGVLCFSLFCYALLCVYSSFAFILKRKRKLVVLLLLSHRCIVAIKVRVGSHVVSVRIHCTEKWRTSFHTDVLSKSK